MKHRIDLNVIFDKTNKTHRGKMGSDWASSESEVELLLRPLPDIEGESRPGWTAQLAVPGGSGDSEWAEGGLLVFLLPGTAR